MANQRFTLPSGRSLGLSSIGDPGAQRLIVVCHPTPGSGAFDPDPTVTAASGAQLIWFDRPGYGASDPLPRTDDPTVDEHADDLASFLRHSRQVSNDRRSTDFDSVGVIGWGAGGATALSLAARHPELVDRIAIVGTAKAAGRGLVEPVRRMLGLSRIQAFSPRSELDRLIAARGSLTSASLGINPRDPFLETPGLAGRLDRMLVEASRQGAVGIATDLLAFRDRSWSLDLPAITADTLLLYGADTTDAEPTVADGHWYRRRITGARVAEVPGAAALTLLTHWGAVLEHVAPGPGRPV